MPNFTKTWIENLPAPEKGQVLQFDTKQAGLGVRITRGSKSFIFQRRVDGKVVRMTIGSTSDWTVDEARSRVRELSVDADKGVDPRARRKKVERDKLILEIAFARFMQDRQLAERTQKDYRYYFEHYFADWGKKEVSSLTGDMVATKFKKIAESRAGSSQANSAMRFLRSLLNFTEATWEGALPQNPVSALSKRRLWAVENKKEDRLFPEQIGGWLEVVRTGSPVMAGYLEIILLTGCRRSEASDLMWADVNRKRETLTFKDTKNGSDRTIPIGKRVGELLTELKNHKVKDCDLVFPSKNRGGEVVPTHWPVKLNGKACKAVGAVCTVHGLRRTFATELERLDCPQTPLKALLGHSMRGDVTTGHYVKVDIERIRPWIHKFEVYILSLDSRHEHNK
jgi:integrase